MIHDEFWCYVYFDKFWLHKIKPINRGYIYL